MEVNFPKIVDKSGNSVSFKDLPKVKALYFSASWCGPCRGFTPELAKFYEAINKNGKKFEVVFVSWDSDDSSFKEYWGKMPWLAVDFSDDKREDLGEIFGVQGIPFVVLIDENGKPISGKSIRGDIINAKSDYEKLYTSLAAQYK